MCKQNLICLFLQPIHSRIKFYFPQFKNYLMCKFCHAKVLVNFNLTVQFIHNSSLDLDTLLAVVVNLHRTT